MKTLLTCSAVIAVLGAMARADDRTTVSTGPALMEGASAVVMPAENPELSDARNHVTLALHFVDEVQRRVAAQSK